MPRSAQKLSERVVIPMTVCDVQDLDDYCAEQRRQTGALVQRATVIRDVVRRAMAAAKERAERPYE